MGRAARRPLPTPEVVMPAVTKRRLTVGKVRRKTNKRLVEAEDICRLEVIDSAGMSPDEKQVAYTVETISADHRRYFAHLFMVDTATGRSRQFTFGEIYDRQPVWSPDGSQLAFLSTRNKKTGIYVIPAAGGGERRICEADGGFGRLVWTPDGRSLIYHFRFNDTHGVGDEQKKKEPPLCRHITRLGYRMDGVGFLPKDRYHIWKTDVADGRTQQLTKGKYDEVDPAISPDGRLIAFVSNRSKDPDLDSLRDDLFVIAISGGRERKIATPPGPVAAPSFSPDGRMIAYLGHANPDDAWGVTNIHVWTVGVDGRPSARDLLSRFDRQTIDQTSGDLGEGHSVAPPTWSADGKRIYFVASDAGNTHIFSVPAKGDLPTRITEGKCHVKTFSLGHRNRRVAAVVSSLADPSQIHLFPPLYHGDAQAKILTHCNRELFSALEFPRIKEIWFKAYDGTELQGWLVTPPNFRKTRKYPAILEIHGGPRVQYGFTFYHEMLFLASRGYVVFYTNPRGGAGRGETFAGTITADWGSFDFQDCMAATDYLERLPFVNPARLGVTGGSYGGYMTNWIVGHTDRFRAAVTQRSVADLKSFVGSSDCGYALLREFAGPPWVNGDGYRRCSPLTYAGGIRTPLLIIHSQGDLRCSTEQAEQLFATLKLLKRRVEMVLFPEEPHGLSRHGRPDRRVARLEWIVRWFDKYL
jgi:dipeptidyl aminopeptidase/acylaminoacyl peptidase